MTINEILIFAKILALVSGGRTVTVTDVEKKDCCRCFEANSGSKIRLDRASEGAIQDAGECCGTDWVTPGSIEK